MTEGNSESQSQENLVTDNAQEVSSHENAHENHEDVASQEAEQNEKVVPLSALQKERKKKQQLQQELEFERQQNSSKEEDYSKYESVTKEDLGRNNFELKREVREEDWENANPDRAAYVNENLKEFLQQRPNLTLAIKESGNRLKESWELMEALKPRKAPAVQKVDREAPKAPGSVPKSSSINQSMNLMNMTDGEFVAWRKSQRVR